MATLPHIGRARLQFPGSVKWDYHHLISLGCFGLESECAYKGQALTEEKTGSGLLQAQHNTFGQMRKRDPFLETHYCHLPESFLTNELQSVLLPSASVWL